ncbi:regulator, partial [Kitasatospora sp. NPDC057738]
MNDVNLPYGLVRNSLAGATTVAGPVVQAGTIHGGLHLHGASALPTPRQLPPCPRRLIGREADLAALDLSLAPDAGAADVTLVVTGPAGVGKTALAAQWLRGPAGHFPAGQSCTGPRRDAPGGPPHPD